MKFLCDLDLSSSDMSLVLSYIPVSYKNYYLTLGTDRLCALGYNVTHIKREYNDKINSSNQTLIEKILSTFKVGERYAKSEIKKILRNIYSGYSLNKVPKAVDLVEYFEIKEGLIPNKITGKRDRCYEILGIKES